MATSPLPNDPDLIAALHEAFDYDPDAGTLHRFGRDVGTRRAPKRPRLVTFDCTEYRAADVAFAIHNKRAPQTWCYIKHPDNWTLRAVDLVETTAPRTSWLRSRDARKAAFAADMVRHATARMGELRLMCADDWARGDRDARWDRDALFLELRDRLNPDERRKEHQIGLTYGNEAARLYCLTKEEPLW